MAFFIRLRQLVTNKQFLLLLCGICAILVYVIMHFQHDKRTARLVYRQMAVVDQQLTNLQKQGLMIKDHQQQNHKLMQAIKVVQHSKCAPLAKQSILALVSQLNYQPQIARTLAQIISQMQLKNCRDQVRQAAVQIRELQITTNTQVNDFNQQLERIEHQLDVISNEITTIRNNRLHNTELAKLRFMHRKLRQTWAELHSSLTAEVLIDVLATVDASTADN